MKRFNYGKLKLFFSSTQPSLYLWWRCIVSFIKLPWYLAKNRKFFFGKLSIFAKNFINLDKDYQDNVKVLSLEGLRKLLDGEQPYIYFRFDSKAGNIYMMEAITLAYIVETMKPKVVFEIGTFDGFSAYHLAMNGRSDAKVYTLNLPLEHKIQSSGGVIALDYARDWLAHAKDLPVYGIGSLYKACSSAEKVTQIFGDSITFDFSDFYGEVNLVFIDGNHALDYIKRDTENAIKMIRRGGMIIWHDFNKQHRDIYRFLIKLSMRLKIFWVEGTRLALYLNN